MTAGSLRLSGRAFPSRANSSTIGRLWFNMYRSKLVINVLLWEYIHDIKITILTIFFFFFFFQPCARASLLASQTSTKAYGWFQNRHMGDFKIIDVGVVKENSYSVILIMSIFVLYFQIRKFDLSRVFSFSDCFG